MNTTKFGQSLLLSSARLDSKIVSYSRWEQCYWKWLVIFRCKSDRKSQLSALWGWAIRGSHIASTTFLKPDMILLLCGSVAMVRSAGLGSLVQCYTTELTVVLEEEGWGKWLALG